MKRAAVLFAIAGLAAGCDEATGFGRVDGRLVLPEVVDFGDVQIGMTAKRQLILKNDGSASVIVLGFSAGRDVAGSRYQFKLPSEGVTVLPAGESSTGFEFQPFEASDEAYEIEVEVQVELQDPQTIRLRGRGIESGLLVEPNPLDFETVLAGASRTLDLTITNLLSEEVILRSAQHLRGRPEAIASSGTGTFDIETEVDAAGDLLNGMPLPAGGKITVPVTYSPDPSNLEASDRARWTISNCDFALCETHIDLRGRGTTSALACSPMGVSFGAVNPGRTLTATVTCTNVAAAEVTVQGWGLESGTASEYELVTPSGSQVLGSGASIVMEVAFTPTQMTWDQAIMPEGALVVRSVHATGAALDPVRIPMTGRAGGPTIVVTPAALRFGTVAVGTTHSRLLLVENVGLEPLDVFEIVGDRDATGAFVTDQTALQLDVGASTVVTVTFAPNAAAPIASAVRFRSNDSINPNYDVPVDGIGRALPPCAYRVTPPRVSFGAVRFSERPIQGVRIENVGNDDCLINDVEIIPNTFGSTTAFTLVNGRQTAIVLAPTDALDVPVEFAPTQPGGDRADLGFYISDPANSNPRVPLYGVGEPLVEVQCPPPVTTPAGVPITLSATGIALGANITGYTWAVVSAPIGGIGTPNQWAPNPPTSATETFLPFIVGVYDIQVTMTDDQGRMAGCTTQVTAEGEGLQVTMTWDGAGDVDLHVHDGVTATPWFANPNDCYYGNRTPIWDAAFPASTGPNPELDFDNTSSLGPENTRVRVPTVGTTYTVAAHNFSRSAGRRVTIDIFCGGVLPQATYVSRPLVGAAAGNCTVNDFWKVAAVTFTGQNTCTIVPIDTYGPSSTACTSF